MNQKWTKTEPHQINELTSQHKRQKEEQEMVENPTEEKIKQKLQQNQEEEKEWQEFLVEFADYIKPGDLEERGLAGNRGKWGNDADACARHVQK